MEDAGDTAAVDAGHHDRRLARRIAEDSEFRREYDDQLRSTTGIDRGDDSPHPPATRPS